MQHYISIASLPTSTLGKHAPRIVEAVATLQLDPTQAATFDFASAFEAKSFYNAVRNYRVTHNLPTLTCKLCTNTAYLFFAPPPPQ